MKIFDKISLVLRNRDYLFLWMSQTLTYLSVIATSLAFILLILLITGSPILAGILGTFSGLTYTLFLLFGNALVRRWKRKSIMMWSNVGQALCFASAPFFITHEHLALILVYLIVPIDACLAGIFDSIKLSSKLQSISSEDLPALTIFSQVTLGVSFIIGPFLGGLFFAFNPSLPFLIAAALNLVSALFLGMVRSPLEGQSTKKTDSLWTKVNGGWKWLKHQPLILSMAWVTCFERLLTEGYLLIMVVAALQQHASPAIIGLIFTLGGIGGILGSLVAPWFQRRFSFATVIVGTLWVTSLFWFLMAKFSTPFMLALILAVLFFISPLYNVVYVDYRHALAPRELQEQVDAVARLISSLLWPIGLIFAGIFLQRNGFAFTALVCATGLGILALVATLNPWIRAAQPVTIDAQVGKESL